MTETDYIEKRLKDQIQWYSDKSGWNQKRFKQLKLIELSCAVSIPFLAAYVNAFWTGLLGAVVAIIAGLLSVYKFQDNWVKYRTTSETLKHHLYLFETNVEPYHDENRFSKLVHNIEGMISKENSEWQSYIVKDKQAKGE